MEDLHLRRLWRLTNTFAKIRQGAFKNKKGCERSHYVYENKENTGKMPDEKSDINVDTAPVLQKTRGL